MKKIIRLTESDLHNIIAKSVKRILKEDVLGNNFHEAEEDQNDVLNNYEADEAFKEQSDGLPFGPDDDFSPLFKNDASITGEPLDPTYNQDREVQGWNDDEPEGYEYPDLDMYKDEWFGDGDGDKYRYGL